MVENGSPDLVAVAQGPRVRVNATMSAKGAYQPDVTVETFDGSDPVPRLLAQIEEVEAALRTTGRKLASDAA